MLLRCGCKQFYKIPSCSLVTEKKGYTVNLWTHQKCHQYPYTHSWYNWPLKHHSQQQQMIFYFFFFFCFATFLKYELVQDKTYIKTCVISKDSDQPALSRRLIRVFADHMCILHPPGNPKRDKREPMAYWVDVLADLRLCWLHRSCCRFCYALAHFFYFSQKIRLMYCHYSWRQVLFLWRKLSPQSLYFLVLWDHWTPMDLFENSRAQLFKTNDVVS